MNQDHCRQQDCDTQNSKIPQPPEPKVRLGFQVLRIQILSQLHSSLLCFCHSTPNADCGTGGVNDRTHIHTDGAVEAKLLCNTRHFVGCQHNAKSKKHVVLECQHSKKQKCSLHKCRQTQSCDLLAPLVESIGVSSGNGEHIQFTHSDLNQQDTTALDVGKEHLDHAVGKGNENQQGL